MGKKTSPKRVKRRTSPKRVKRRTSPKRVKRRTSPKRVKRRTSPKRVKRKKSTRRRLNVPPMRTESDELMDSIELSHALDEIERMERKRMETERRISQEMERQRERMEREKRAEGERMERQRERMEREESRSSLTKQEREEFRNLVSRKMDLQNSLDMELFRYNGQVERGNLSRAEETFSRIQELKREYNIIKIELMRYGLSFSGHSSKYDL